MILKLKIKIKMLLNNKNYYLYIIVNRGYFGKRFFCKSSGNGKKETFTLVFCRLKWYTAVNPDERLRG